MLKNKSLLIFFVLLFVLSSCKISKKIFHSTSKLEKASLEELFKGISSTSIDYNTLRIKFQGKINSPDNNLGISGQIRVLKDSILWANATALLGIEVGRILVTKDSVFLQNNLKNEISIYPIKQFADSFGIRAELSVLENFLLGQLSRLDFNGYERQELLRKSSENYQYSAMYYSETNFMQYDAYLNAKSYRVDSLFLGQKNENNHFRLDYPAYAVLDSVQFPARMSIKLETPKSKALFMLQYKKIYLDKKFSIPALSMSKYKLIRY